MQTLLIPLNGNLQRVTGASYGNNFRSLVAFGYSGFTGGYPVSNVGTSYLGYNTGALPYSVSAGSYASIDVPWKKLDNLNNLWMKGTSGDSLYIVVY